ncbi:VOC family protein [Sphingosinicella sp. CPCC 101087]|uniref:VOC family protein n=1 Tax=Sphingosinicella sp. CPCC 101087 TaxID=2497754 RepID=UPI00101D956B
MQKITPCLWFNHNAEEAANFYVTLLPDSRIDKIVHAPADTPSGSEGSVLVVEFTLSGQNYIGLNGGPNFPFTEAVSFMIRTEDQAETDRLWEAHLANGGEESACGWLKDRWGLSWQITPKRLLELVSDPDPARARRATQAMMKMVKIDIAEVERAADAAEPEAATGS